ncbi:MAG: hypothetical protein Q7U56_08820 [Humidesulfovibrio sp.]|nr:hypothetical protein [Humidesulfovibrio sp.]
MQVRIKEQHNALIPIDQLQAGQVGVIERSPFPGQVGRVLLCIAPNSCIDLATPMNRWLGGGHHLVRLLPVGTKIELTVEV